MRELRHVCGLALALMVGLGLVGCSKGLVGRPPDLSKLSPGSGGNPAQGNPGSTHGATTAAGGTGQPDTPVAATQDISAPTSSAKESTASVVTPAAQSPETEVAAQNRMDIAVTQPFNSTEQYALDSTDFDLLSQQGLLDTSERAALGSFVRK